MNSNIEWLRKPLVILLLALAAGRGGAQSIWVDDDKNNLFTINLTTNTLSFVTTITGLGSTPSDNQITDIAFDSAGKLWGITFASLYQIDTSTGVATRATNLLGGGNGSPSFTSLVFDAGTLYAANQGVGQPSGQLFTVNADPNSASFGVASSLSGLPGSTSCESQQSVQTCNTQPGFRSSGDLAFVNGTLYLSSANAGSPGTPDTLLALGAAGQAGAGTVLPTPPNPTPGSLGEPAVWGLATVDGGLYAAAGKSIYTVNTGTGAMNLVKTYSTLVDDPRLGNFNGATYEGAAMVPEPGTYAMLLAGLGVMGLLARRRLPHVAA